MRSSTPLYAETGTTTVTERGQTAIPARLRKACGVTPGTILRWEVIDHQEWRVRIEAPIAPDADPMAMLGFAKRFRATRPTEAWMQELRAGDVAQNEEADEGSAP